MAWRCLKKYRLKNRWSCSHRAFAVARRTAGSALALQLCDGGGDLSFIHHHRLLFYRAAAGARMLTFVRERAAHLLGGLLQHAGRADDVAPADVLVVDFTELPQAKRVVSDGYLGDFLAEPLPGVAE